MQTRIWSAVSNSDAYFTQIQYGGEHEEKTLARLFSTVSHSYQWFPGAKEEKRKMNSSEKFYDVERVITKRDICGKVQYKIVCEGRY